MDFGRTVEDYGRCRPGFPRRLLDELAALGLIRPELDVVDLGTGTGALARLLAPRVGSVTGVDPSQTMLDTTRAGRWPAGRASTRAGSATWPARASPTYVPSRSTSWCATRPELRHLLAGRFPGEAVEVPHRTWAVVGTRVARSAAG